MKFYIQIIIAAAFIFSGTWSVKAQDRPASINLAECAVIYEGITQQAIAEQRPQATVQKLQKAAASFYNQAIIQSKAEGAEDPESIINQSLQPFIDKWDVKLQSPSSDTETQQWVSYCIDLGRFFDILPKD